MTSRPSSRVYRQERQAAVAAMHESATASSLDTVEVATTAALADNDTAGSAAAVSGKSSAASAATESSKGGGTLARALDLPPDNDTSDASAMERLTSDDDEMVMDVDVKDALEILNNPQLYAEYLAQLGTVTVSRARHRVVETTRLRETWWHLNKGIPMLELNTCGAPSCTLGLGQ